MDGGEDRGVDVGSHLDRAWLYRRAFAPGSEALRGRVADALARRSGEVVAAVLASITAHGEDPVPRRVLDSQAEYARQGTGLIVRWVRTGAVASQQEFDVMGQGRRKAVSVTGQITRMVRANLAFREVVQGILREEVGKLGGSMELLLGLWAGVDAGFCQNLLSIGRVFDHRSQAFEEALAEKESQLQHQALHDPLTGLANRSLLFDRLDQACERMRRHPDRGGVGVIFIDLDDLKLINDRFGHAAGDSVLRETARRLTATVRPEDTVARLGGDEFVVMCESVPDAAWADAAGCRIAEDFAVPMEVDGTVMLVGASLGTAVGFPPEGEVEDLVRRADDAMYRVKRATKDLRRYRAVRGPRSALPVPEPLAT